MLMSNGFLAGNFNVFVDAFVSEF